MVMAPAPRPARPRQHRFSLRCRLGWHIPVLAIVQDAQGRWAVSLRYCARCWRLDEAHARELR